MIFVHEHLYDIYMIFPQCTPRQIILCCVCFQLLFRVALIITRISQHFVWGGGTFRWFAGDFGEGVSVVMQLEMQKSLLPKGDKKLEPINLLSKDMGVSKNSGFSPKIDAWNRLWTNEPGSKLVVLGMAIPSLIRNPHNVYINPYYWVDDHPLLYGNNGSLDPSTNGWFWGFPGPLFFSGWHTYLGQRLESLLPIWKMRNEELYGSMVVSGSPKRG